MIEFENVSKVYPGNQVAAKDINMSFERGQFIVFIGTSGSGKTTCMRMINRMIEPTNGRILIDGKDIAKMDAVELRRRIGYVIQQIGLMPHMTIYDNITMVPKLLKWDKDKQRETALRLLERVGMPESYLDRYPSELSGGQQQRIGVIRALAADQNIILMDEPFGALDPITRDSLQTLIKQMQQEMGKTVIFVTHDMDEALSLADRIAILDKGELIQFDTPDNILLNPANKFVEDFLGEDRMNQARSTTQTVDQIMYRYPVTINKNQSTLQALSKMREHRVDSIFVTDDDGVLLGVVDVFDIDQRGRHNEPLTDLMKTCVYVPENTKIRDAIYSIMKLGYRNLPVVDAEYRITGIMTRAAVVESIYNSVWNEEETAEIVVPDVVQTTPTDDSVPPELQQVLEETESQEPAADQVAVTAGGDLK